MRICVLVPSEAYLAQAGVRIRYQRIQSLLADDGIELVFTNLDDLRNERIDGDVYLFSKCYDARSFLAANVLARAGKVIGMDFFDDYFSQSIDARFDHLREAARQLAPLLHFTLCSTGRMRDVATKIVPDRPCHILNDPYESFDADALAVALEAKVAKARSDARISVAWFGIGENDHFPIGLRDLAAFCGEIGRLGTGAFKPKLTILTNLRALTLPYLRMLNRISVEFEVEEWSVERERALLGECVLCFLPVRAQPFSIAKSLNRCISALTKGAQVLSSGYPLYEPFDNFIYQDANAFVRDLEAGRLRLRAETIDELGDILDHWSTPAHEAHRLTKFLRGVMAEKRSSINNGAAGAVALLHGAQTLGASHKLAQRLGYLSVGTPFSPASLNYDADFRATAGGGVELVLANRAVPLLDPSLKPLMKQTESRNGRPANAIDLSIALGRENLPKEMKSLGVSKLRVLATYGPLMASFEGMTKRAFPRINTFVSDGTAYLVGRKSPPLSYH